MEAYERKICHNCSGLNNHTGPSTKYRRIKYSQPCNDLKYFLDLRILTESADISNFVLEVYINHLDELREDIRVCFRDLDNMYVPEWLVTPFD